MSSSPDGQSRRTAKRMGIKLLQFHDSKLQRKGSERSIQHPCSSASSLHPPSAGKCLKTFAEIAAPKAQSSKVLLLPKLCTVTAKPCWDSAPVLTNHNRGCWQFSRGNHYPNHRPTTLHLGAGEGLPLCRAAESRCWCFPEASGEGSSGCVKSDADDSPCPVTTSSSGPEKGGLPTSMPPSASPGLSPSPEAAPGVQSP